MKFALEVPITLIFKLCANQFQFVRFLHNHGLEFSPLEKTISLVQILEEGAGVEVIEFPDMQHGWTVRGDMSDPKVKR